jgi:hypothetical protein
MDPEDRLHLIALVAQDKAWDAVVKVGQVILDCYYPPDVFTGASGDPGPEYIVCLREALNKIRKTEKS